MATQVPRTSTTTRPRYENGGEGRTREDDFALELAFAFFKIPGGLEWFALLAWRWQDKLHHEAMDTEMWLGVTVNSFLMDMIVELQSSELSET